MAAVAGAPRPRRDEIARVSSGIIVTCDMRTTRRRFAAGAALAAPQSPRHPWSARRNRTGAKRKTALLRSRTSAICVYLRVAWGRERSRADHDSTESDRSSLEAGWIHAGQLLKANVHSKSRRFQSDECRLPDVSATSRRCRHHRRRSGDSARRVPGRVRSWRIVSAYPEEIVKLNQENDHCGQFQQKRPRVLELIHHEGYNSPSHLSTKCR